MNPATARHPQAQDLAAFVSGQAPEETATGISQHLAECETCRTLMDELPPDTLLSLLRGGEESAGRVTAAPVNARTADAATIAPTARETAVVLPAELAEHPRYRVLELLGSGGMGAVYKAEHRRMERQVALKVMSAGLMTRPAMVERFHREVKAAARLSHPNIVTAYDADQARDAHFLVMEFVDGESLAQHIQRRGSLPLGEACDYIRQAALGLQHAFERGMVHRDIKPHNLMLTPGGQVKILDFGLARFVRESAAENESSSCAAEGAPTPAGLTEVGTLMGTADFIAPEQANDPRQADIRADIYSLGCTLYFLLTGRVPFPEGTSLDKLLAHVEKTPESLTKLRPDVPGELVRILDKMMAKDPARRYQTPAEVAGALATFTRSSSAIITFIRRQKRRLVAAAGLLLATLLAAGVIYVQTDSGEFVIETDDPEVAVAIAGKGITLHDRQSGRKYHLERGKYRIRSGEYDIDARELGDGIALSTPAFKLSRGGQESVIVRFRSKGNRDYLMSGLSWFPADITFVAARDMRVFPELSLQQLIVLSEVAHTPGRADAVFSKLVRDVGQVDRVTVGYAADSKNARPPRLYARLTGAIKRERLLDHLKNEWPGVVVREIKADAGQPVTIVDSSAGAAPAFAFIGSTDVLLAADLGPEAQHRRVLEQLLTLRSAKGPSKDMAALRAFPEPVPGETIPQDAWAFFAGRPPAALGKVFLFPALAESILVTVHGTQATQFRFQGRFADAEDAQRFAKNLTAMKSLALTFVKNASFAKPAVRVVTDVLTGLDVSVSSVRVSGGYEVPAEGMHSLAEMVQNLPLSDIKKLVFGGGPLERNQHDDASALQGTWKPFVATRAGRPLALGKTSVVFTGNKMSWTMPDGRVHEGIFKLDSSRRPKEIDLIPANAVGIIGIARGVYSLVADSKGDVLTLCLGEPQPGEPPDSRPTRLGLSRDPKHILMLLRRVPGDDGAARSAC